MEKQTTSVGRRKEAVTRIFISKGSGKITVNDKDYKVYFPLVSPDVQKIICVCRRPTSAHCTATKGT